ncbi:MAG: exonuclease VII small subunit [Epsilonproteobacteria bacterium]|nr:exonuclease VII small subunit [Campylobacterota bacterium]
MQDFEKKIEEAKKLLEKLNDPEITLYEAMEVYKKGLNVLEEASKMIEEAKLIFEELK